MPSINEVPLDPSQDFSGRYLYTSREMCHACVSVKLYILCSTCTTCTGSGFKFIRKRERKKERKREDVCLSMTNGSPQKHGK